jgi:NitT/TauT family transport system substrate-binding protein
MIKRRFKVIVASTLAFVIVLLVAFLINHFRVSPDRGERDNIVHHLKWEKNAGFIGDLYADTYGLYRAAGLEVTIESGGLGRDPIRAIELGDAQFGIASADQVLKALYRGADVVVVAQIYRANPVQWIYRAQQHTIKDPSDLQQKRIGVAYGDNVQTIMEAFLRRNDIKDVTLVGVQFDYTPFLTGSVDLFPVYRNTQGVELSRQLEREKEPVAFFDPAGPNGVHFVANSVVTSSKMIRQNEVTVRHFVEATLEGWADALSPENEDAAVRALVAQTGQDEVAMREQIQATREFIIPQDQSGAKLGAIEVKDWEETEVIMREAGLFDTPEGERPSRIDITGYLRTDFVK